MVAVGHVGVAVVEVVEVAKVVTIWIGMRGSVRERGSALSRVFSYCALAWGGRMLEFTSERAVVLEKPTWRLYARNSAMARVVRDKAVD